MNRLTITLTTDEMQKLREQASTEMRDTRNQAKYLILRGLDASKSAEAGNEKPAAQSQRVTPGQPV